MDTELNEMKACVTGRLTLDEFAFEYFGARYQDYKYVNDAGEVLLYRVLSEFYDDYICSRLDFKKYREETTDEEYLGY